MGGRGGPLFFSQQRAERFGSASEQNRSEYAFAAQKVP